MRQAGCQLCLGMFLIMLLPSCSNEATFVAADHSRCRQLGYHPGSADYAICLSEVRRQRVGLAAMELRD